MKFALCNEMFGEAPFDEVCREAAAAGYQGVEIAPFTLAPLVTDLSLDDLHRLRRQAEDAGVEVVGLHWLLAKTTGRRLLRRLAIPTGLRRLLRRLAIPTGLRRLLRRLAIPT